MVEHEAAPVVRLKHVCVFCGAYKGSRLIYQDATIALGKELVKRKLNLVYGGANVGLMGMISQAVHQGGQKVIGVIPKSLVGVVKMEGGTEPVGEVIEVDDMHQRKAKMACLADAFIALPGGFGTWDEVLEQINWYQLGIHNKPVGLLNVDGYYDSLLLFLEHAVREEVMTPACRSMVIVASNASELLSQMENAAMAAGALPASTASKHIPRLHGEQHDKPSCTLQTQSCC